MNCAQINIIACKEGRTLVVVDGRANFEAAVPLREFVNTLTGDFRSVAVDLQKCTGMDSTFMGVLSMLGLKARKCGARVEILNASDSNRGLLKGLGVARLFQFAECDTSVMAAEDAAVLDTAAAPLETAETVLQAHETLMDVDEENVKKFQQVVDFARKDVDRLQG